MELIEQYMLKNSRSGARDSVFVCDDYLLSYSEPLEAVTLEHFTDGRVHSFFGSDMFGLDEFLTGVVAPPESAVSYFFDLPDSEKFSLLMSIIPWSPTESAFMQISSLKDYYRSVVDTQFNWPRLYSILADLPSEELPSGGVGRLVLLGGAKNLTPSGKYFEPHLNLGATPWEIAHDSAWLEALQEFADASSGWIESPGCNPDNTDCDIWLLIDDAAEFKSV